MVYSADNYSFLCIAGKCLCGTK